MALGKRGFKRPTSSSSYASTVTTIIFIALCVLGVWMLTSNIIAPPQTSVRTSTTGDSKTAFSSSNDPDETAKSGDKKSNTVFEDNPGELPEDAIKADKHEREQGSTTAGGGGSNHDENKAKEQESVVDKNVLDLREKESVEEQEKQKESEIQISEESTLTQKQQAEQTDLVQKSNNNEEKKGNDQDQNTVAKIGESTLQMLPNQTSDADHQKLNNAEKEQRKEEIQSQLQQQQQQRQQEQIKQGSQTNNINNKIPQNDKSNEEMIKQQLQEDAGNQTIPRDSQNQGQQNQQIQEIKPNVTDLTVQSKLQQEQNPSSTSEKPQQQTTAADPNTKLPDQNQENKPQQQQEAAKQDRTKEHKPGESNTAGSILGGGTNPGIPKESTESKKSWKTQATQSLNEKERRRDETDNTKSFYGYSWNLCNETAGPDYIPCLDNEKAISKLPTTRHFEHRERHCPELAPICLVPLPKGYKRSIAWPTSRDKIWYNNVPNTVLAEVKGHQNWVKVEGEHLTFPGGGTQFIHGALHYIAFIQESVPNITWGKHVRVVLDVGCGVASFGGYLFDRDVLTMSFAPKDEHEAQVQFALERGIPAISAVMGSQRLPFPSRVFDLIHCARCRVPWHEEGGRLLLELNRVLRPGGYFAWSATPVYQTLQEDVEIWKAMTSLTKRMCWELVTVKKDKINSAGMAVYRKPTSNDCYGKRKHKTPPLCKEDEDPNAAWYISLQPCIHRLPVESTERGFRWPEEWPVRLQTPPYWLNSSQNGIYGKPAPQDFERDYEHWKRVVSTSYMSGLGITWSNVRNVMDMRAVYGGFAAALKELQVWVMNVVNVDSPDTLPIIYERGLFGIYHDWCESFSTYPRTYDLLHADHLFSKLKKRCKLVPVLAEVDRIVRPGGKLIVRDESAAISEVENLLKSLRWEVHLTFSKDQEGILSAQKGDWRPDTYQTPT